MNRTGTVVFALALALAAPRLDAVIITGNQLEINFADAADAAAKASWSKPDKLTISNEGLGWDGGAASLWDGWIQTTPLALGLSWRPTGVASIRVAIHPLPKEFDLHDGQKSTPYGGDVYVRYSPDCKHWSSWQVLQQAEPQNPDEKMNPGRHFSGTIRVPYREREEYSARLMEYAQQDVPWSSDEEAAVQWILQKEPDFFAKHLPFMGYIQFLYEGSFHGGQRIKSLKADVSYALSGIHSIPKETDSPQKRDHSAWRFKADEENKSNPTSEPEK